VELWPTHLLRGIREAWRQLLCGVALTIAVLFAGADRAATLTWTGNAGDGLIASAGNWSPSQVPAANDAFVFAGTNSLLPQLVSSLTVDSITFDNTAGAFTLGGAGIYSLNANGITNNSTNLETINNPLKLLFSQTWSASAGGLAFGGAVNTNAKTLTIDGSFATTISSVISGTGALIKNGSGTLTLSGTNTYSGATTINAGVINIQNATALGTTGGGTTVNNGAALQVQGNIAVGNEALTLNGSGIANDGALRNISGTNSMSGAVTLGSAATIGSDAGTLTLSGAVTNVGFLLTETGAGNVTLGGVVSGTGGLTKNGSGTLTLTGSNTFTGTTTVNAGVLALNSGANAIAGSLVVGDNVSSAGTGTVRLLAADQLPDTTAVTVNSSGVLDWNGFDDKVGATTLFSGDISGASITTGAGKFHATGTITLSISGTGAVGATISGNMVDGGAVRTIFVNDGAADADLTISAVMQGSHGYIKDGPGRLVMSGANLSSGTFTINAGPAQLQNADAISSFSSTTVNSGGALEFAGGIAFNADPVTLNGSGVSGTGAILNVSGTNTFGGALTIGSATTFGSDSGSLTLSDTFSNAGFLLTMTGAGNLTFSGVISSTGGLTKNGAGKLTLSGVNTYSGGTTINAGTVAVNSASSFGATSGAVTLNAGTVEVTTGFSTTRVYNLGDVASTFQIDPSQTFTDTTAIGGAGTLNKTGTGTMITSGVNTYSLGTVLSAGMLQLSGSGTLGSTSGSLTVNGGTLDLNGTNQTVGALSGSGGTILNNSTGTAKTLNVGTGNSSGSYAGVIADHSAGTGTLALTKTGSGSQTLTGTNTYTGATTVNAGSLFVNGSTAASSAVTVNNSGSTIGGSGTIGGSVNVASSGANLSPGASGVGSTAILHTGALTLASGSNFNVDLNSTTAGTGYDQLNVIGALSITGSNLVITAGTGLQIGDKFFIALNDASDAITGTFAQGATITASNLADTFIINYVDNGDGGGVGNDISLTCTFAVPEPSTYAAAILALGALAFHQRKRFGRSRKIAARS
jgi:fibronectin-binding autotransporter adhesin